MTEPTSADVQLVIFDLDGVLVDLQHAENGALAHLAELMDLPLTRRQADELFSGKKLGECIELIEDMSGNPAPDGAVRLVRETCEQIIGPTFTPIDGVEYALTHIHADKCVASNSPPEIIERRLSKSGIASYFGDKIYSAYEIDAWKPDPKLFLWAASDLGVRADEALVIEDSPVGVEAAIAAGMRVLQFCGDGPATPHREGARTFSSMRMLPELIGEGQ